MPDQQTLHTLAEAAELTGLSVEALRLRIKRGKLTAERGNDGQPRVRLTTADLEGLQRKRGPTLVRQPPTPTNELKVLEEAVGVLREALAREREGADRLRAERDAAVKRAADAEREREEARIRAASAEGELKGRRWWRWWT